jgi:hypothetical protein
MPTEIVKVDVVELSGGGVTCEKLSVAVTPDGAPETLN